MNTRNMTREVRLGHWSKLINERNASGKTVKRFCDDQGISMKTYYYWLRKLREAAYLESGGCLRVQEGGVTENAPVFAEIKINRASPETIALVVKIGNDFCEIMNGAEKDVIENTLRALKNIC